MRVNLLTTLFLCILRSFLRGESFEFCPSNCENVKCISKIGPLDCPKGSHYVSNLSIGSCCPSCVTYLEIGDSCDWSHQKLFSETVELECSKERIKNKTMSTELEIPILHLLRCHPSSGGCKEGLCAPSFKPCPKAREKYNDWLTSKNCDYMDWTKDCDESFDFESEQIKRNAYYRGGKAFCVNRHGKRIYGDGGNCECSRRRDQIESSHVFLHCNASNGAFEELQCDLGTCWCLKSFPTTVSSPVVPESLIELLPCWKGQPYYRRCEKRNRELIKVVSILRAHGSLWESKINNDCDWNGGYGLIRCQNDPIPECSCVDSFGKTIGNYKESYSNKDKFNCQCARDGSDTSYECETPFGNYKELQSANSCEWCLDKDGFPLTRKYPRRKDGIPCFIPGCPEAEKRCAEQSCSNCTLENSCTYVSTCPESS